MPAGGCSFYWCSSWTSDPLFSTEGENINEFPLVSQKSFPPLPLTTCPISGTMAIIKEKNTLRGWERIAVLSPPIFVIPTRSRRLYTRECCIFVLTIARLIPESQAYRFIYGERGLAFLFVPCVWTLKNRLPRAMVQIAHRNRISFAHEGPGACQ